MNAVSDLLSRLLRGALRLVLVLAAMVFVLSFLLAALVAVLLMSVWSLITGRKPAPVVMFSRMREQSRQYTQGVWPGRTPPGHQHGKFQVSRQVSRNIRIVVAALCKTNPI